MTTIRLTKNRVTAPFTIVVDSREKHPFTFTGILSDAKEGNLITVVPTVTAVLRTGDYTLFEHEDSIAVERKSANDLITTVIRERARFVAELERLASIEFAHVIVESDWRTILHRAAEVTSAPPKTIFRSVVSWSLRFPSVHWWMAGDRFMAERICFRLLSTFHRHSKRIDNNTRNVWED